ncbi:TonB-dependent receptor [Pseudoteredinibacter isoporae]|uniref:Outer membrane receptor protein involved in Fe transport n=1 Tax=Pseudoteredinibacter isoporae TaxID=570281 RepID=A0A7X0JUP4_9GAMM|nr:TonB-dependent receptor [Pseudoteredinibacter isoporae]MBB6522620.1 outer membrane receptor protein involved in Fe transport [Pseudoteredinibacter isoporae]NHO88150.1 TonB-dependent receptor [Pseudoteredinibacter isoporae]NIB23519.1 TonB-dependent receptor [Pseudoteredinibacter isoporae]
MPQLHSSIPKTRLLTIAISSLCFTAGGHAQTLEEVIVTAQKRAESLQDVPISVSAMSGEKMSDAGIQSFTDMNHYVPSFSVTKDPIGDKINIRGIQSGNQAGFEQSVGTFVDGIYRGRGTQSRYSFLDVEAVEILRGPQGTLFGKNTIAGALNIRSAKPTDELAGQLSASYNIEFETTDLQGFISGPLSDSVRGRLFLMNREMDKGWVHNSFYNADVPVSDEKAGRLSLEIDLGENTTLRLKTEAADFTTVGQPWDILVAGGLSAFGISSAADYRISMGNLPRAPFTHFGANGEFQNDPNGVLDFGAAGHLDGDSNETAITLEHVTDQGTITAILGHSAYEFQRLLDADFGPTPSVRFDDSEDFDQKSFELRFASDTDGQFNYITGMFYQEQDLTVDGLSYFNFGTLQPLLNGGCAGAVGAAYPALFVSGDALTTASNVAGAVGAAGGAGAALASACGQAAAFEPLVNAGINGGNRYALLDQSTESWAVFFQGTYEISDSTRLTLGLRYTEEEKSASQSVRAAAFEEGGTTALTNPLLIGAIETVGEFSTHSFTPSDPGMSRDEESLTWSANFQWDVNNDTMVYASASTGFKAGGFNSFYMALGQPDNSQDASFEEEEVISFEVGSKMTLLDGAAELNLALFRTEFDDLQASIFTGGTTFVVQNAAKAVTQGLEIDGRWALTDQLNMQAAFAYIDFEYENFPNQACTAAQFSSARQAAYEAALNAGSTLGAAAAALTYTNGSCAAAGLNDLQGKTSENTPELQFSMGLSHTQSLGDNFELLSNLNVSWTDDVFRQADLDPVSLQESYWKVDANITLASADGRWDVSLIGNNLTDEDTLSYVNDTPLFNGTHQAALEQPRSFTIRGRWHL